MGVQRHPPKDNKRSQRGRGDDEDDELDVLEIMVPQLIGDTNTIKFLKSSEAVRNLGLFVRPDGCSDKHML